MADPIEIKKSKKSEDITSLAQSLRTPESKVILDEMAKISEDPQYARTTPPETQSALRDAIAEARDLYQRKATNNEWAEVAQTLAGAVAKFGAARSGLNSGRDLSGVSAGPNIDYGARTDNAFRDYVQTVKNASDSADRTRQDWADTETVKGASLKQALSPQEDRLKNAQAIELEEGRQAREDAREGRGARREQDRIDNTNKTLEYRDNAKQADALANEIRKTEENGNKVANRIVSEGISSKDLKKNAAQYGDLLAGAKLDADDIARIEENSKGEGIFGTGIFRSEDKEKKAQLIKEAVAAKTREMRNILDALRARNAEIIGKSGTTGQTPAPEVESESATVKVKGPSGEIAEMSPEKAKKYLGKPGYTQVP